ncbi:MAG: hypothetical protein VX642_07095, partial [Bdellovibrionota bacterium]|nr:hypothetical protein [Bdellovibrionota bacterium]
RLSGIEPQPRSWVIGLLNIVKTYSNAAANLLSMAATSLDYQYNSKMFASFKDLSEIKSMDMDIVMYGRKKLKKFHTRLFGKGPLKDSFGNEIEIQVDGKTYYFYHFLGSEFLSKYLDIRYHEPSFSSQTAFLKQKERTEIFQAHLQKVRHTLAEEKKGKVNDIVTFANRQIAYMRQLFLSSNNREAIEALGNLILLGKNLTPEAMLGRHEHIAFYQAQLAQILPEFVAASSSKRFKSNEEFQQFMSQLSQKDIQENILQLGMLTSVIGYDPLLFYLNNGGRFFPVAN